MFDKINDWYKRYALIAISIGPKKAINVLETKDYLLDAKYEPIVTKKKNIAASTNGKNKKFEFNGYYLGLHIVPSALFYKSGGHSELQTFSCIEKPWEHYKHFFLITESQILHPTSQSKHWIVPWIWVVPSGHY